MEHQMELLRRLSPKLFVHALAILCTASLVLTESRAGADPVPAQWRRDQLSLSCEPDTLKPGESLKLKFGLPHAAELAIVRDRDDTFFYLISKFDDPKVKQLMDPKSFRTTRDLVLGQDLVANSSDNSSQLKRVFEASGKYRVLLSDALESEEGGVYCAICLQDASGGGCK